MEWSHVGRQRGKVIAVALSLSAFLVSGCGLNVSLLADPDPTSPGTPITYSVAVTNQTNCNLGVPLVLVLVLIPEIRFDGQIITEQLCDAFSDPKQIFCGLIEDPTDPDVPEQLIWTCCDSSPEFAAANPEVCDRDTAVAMSSEDVRAQIEQFFAANPIPDINVGDVSIKTADGAAVNCQQLGQRVFLCQDTVLLKTKTLQFDVTATPLETGRFFNYVFSFGTPILCTPDLLPAGSECVETLVTAGRPAPTLSPVAIGGLFAGLGALGAYTLHRRRRR